MDLFKRLRREYEHGVGTIRGVARKFSVHRRTVRAALNNSARPKRKTPQRARPKMASAMPFIDTILGDDLSLPWNERHTVHGIWQRLRAQVPGFAASELSVQRYVRAKKIQMNATQTSQVAATWMIEVLTANNPLPLIKKEVANSSDLSGIADFITRGRLRDRKKALVILAHLRGIRTSAIAEYLGLSRRTIGRYVSLFYRDGCKLLFAKRRAKTRNDQERKQTLFSLLHSPPSVHGINRTSWRMEDLHRMVVEHGHRTSKKTIRAWIKAAGFKWRKAKVVLTSKDPDYQKKVEAIKRVLSKLRADEAFFSIDEYGPFAVKRKGGRKRVGPGESYVVPQWQKSKGCLILTAALELSRNQITHFYSRRKDTDEMIKMADVLRSQYQGCATIYLSWDAASWHIAKRLFSHLHESNQHAADDGCPIVKTAPLPAGAQFLNVIESVFSGMAKAVIHNSDYSSVETTKAAIDSYFKERNEYFAQHPKRAGRKIWGQERVPSEFSEAHNCKDPLYR